MSVGVFKKAKYDTVTIASAVPPEYLHIEEEDQPPDYIINI